MAFNVQQRRRSSWFGPQFSMQSFSFGAFTSSLSSHSSTSDLRRDSKTQESKSRQQSASKLSVAEPLFHDCYLSPEEDLSTMDVKTQVWSLPYDDMDLAPDETLEELGFALDDEDSNIIATYISIINVGKPKVIDISPPISIREQKSSKLVHSSVRLEDRNSIYWRVPSYESSSRSSSTYSGRTDRTESFDSRSSVSESPKTPDLIASFLSPESESTKQTVVPDRARTLRRQSRNLSVSLSKAFLGRLRDSSPIPPLPVDSSMAPSRDPIKSVATLQIHSDLLPQRTPVLRRRRDHVGESWYYR